MKRQILKTDGENDSEYYFSPRKNNQIKLRSKTSKDEKKISTTIGIIASDMRRKARSIF